MAQDFVQMDLLSWSICCNPLPEYAAIMSEGYSRDEAKLLHAGFSLVRYQRELKQLDITTAAQYHRGWCRTEPFATYAAAERHLASLKVDGCIEVNLHGFVIMSGWFQPEGLKSKGFEFYRVYGLKDYDQGSCCIKVGSKNWSNLAKYPDRETLQAAWDELMLDPKALEG